MFMDVGRLISSSLNMSEIAYYSVGVLIVLLAGLVSLPY